MVSYNNIKSNREIVSISGGTKLCNSYVSILILFILIYVGTKNIKFGALLLFLSAIIYIIFIENQINQAYKNT